MAQIDTVKQTQTWLKTLGFYNLAVDGQWGNGSRAALEALINSTLDPSKPNGINKLSWGSKFKPAEIARLKQMITNLRWPAAAVQWQMGAMAFETGRTLSPATQNGIGACVDVETEILTRSGWKKYNEISKGDVIHSINYETGKMEDDQIQRVNILKSSDVYSMTSRSFDSVSTGDHRWYLHKREYQREDKTPTTVIKTTEEILNLKSSSLYSVPHIHQDHIAKDVRTSIDPIEMYMLLGLIAGDGSINKKTGRVQLDCHSSANLRELEAIETCVEYLFPEGVAVNAFEESGMLRWRFNAEQSAYILGFFDVEYNSNLSQSRFIKKIDPALFKTMDYRAASGLLGGYLMSDGHLEKQRLEYSFRNTEQVIIDDFIHTAILCGENPRQVTDHRGGNFQVFPNGKSYIVKDIHTVYLRMARYTSINKAQLKTEKLGGEHTVWCPTTRNSTWIARRNGTVYVTGNCGLIQFIKPTAVGLGTTTDALAKMTVLEQLEYVEKYFTPYAGKVKSISGLYMCILWPAAAGKADDFVLWTKEKQPTTYKQNAGLDMNLDGTITVGECSHKVVNALVEGFIGNNVKNF